MYIDLTGNSNDIFYGHEGLVIFNTGDVYGTPYKYDGGFVDMREDIYAPLVMVNGVGATSVGDAKVTGTFYEGYNLLTPRFRARFTTCLLYTSHSGSVQPRQPRADPRGGAEPRAEGAQV